MKKESESEKKAKNLAKSKAITRQGQLVRVCGRVGKSAAAAAALPAR